MQLGIWDIRLCKVSVWSLTAPQARASLYWHQSCSYVLPLSGPGILPSKLTVLSLYQKWLCTDSN